MTRGTVSVGIGQGLRTKVNVNLGTSPAQCDSGQEVRKAILAEQYGADTLSELSMGGNITEIRRNLFGHSHLPITTVPIYQDCAEKRLQNLTWEQILATIRAQAAEGSAPLSSIASPGKWLKC